ncbi:MAG: hypothetical protein EON86_03905 [Brevundimonas sp.]|nr:MAG: hypothetical protein EON86_03905 [Brevundimonas sp.]
MTPVEGHSQSLWEGAIVPALLVGVALAWQALAGFRISGEAGRAAEVMAWLMYAVAIVLFLKRLDRKRALMAGGLALVLMFVAIDLNTRWVTMLDLRYGGSYSWSGMRQAAATYFIGPLAGIVVGILTGLLVGFGRRRQHSEAAS